jgi:hypothetical protein
MVDRSEVNQMSQFMRALNGESVLSENDPFETLSVERPLLGTDKEVAKQDMQMILERFYRATDGVYAEAAYQPELRESLMTEEVPGGLRIGEWEIRATDQGKRTTYDIVQVGESVCIASDIMLYEAAHGLVRILNNGGKINSVVAVELMHAENQYASALHDAVLYKYHIRNNPHSKKISVYEARYSAAARRAVQARDRVEVLAESRL